MRFFNAILFVLSASISAMASTGSATTVPAISLDTHIHIQNNYPEDIKTLTRVLQNAEFALILSSSYGKMIELQSLNPDDIAQRRYPRIGLAERRLNIEIDHQQTSTLTKQFSGKAFGLCGMNLWWQRDLFQEVLEICLNKPGMIGAKLHFSENRNSLAGLNRVPHYIQDPISAEEILSQFELLASELNKLHGVLLIHFDFIETPGKVRKPGLNGADRGNSSGTGGTPIDDREAQKLIEIANRNPNTKFIIAHSGVGQSIGLVGLRSIGAAFTKSTRRNIYLEVSNTLFQNGVKENLRDPSSFTKAWQNNKEIIEAWRSFGMDWILFGSDGDEMAREQILNNPLLTSVEKEKILFRNGRRLLREKKINNDQLLLRPEHDSATQRLL